MDHSGPRPGEGVHPQPLFVQGDGADEGSLPGKDGPEFPIARVLHGVATLPPQELKEDACEVLRPGPHHHLVRVGVDAPEGPEVVHDGGAEGGHPLGMDGGEKPAVLPAQDLPHELGPGGEGKPDGVHGVGGKVIPGRSSDSRGGPPDRRLRQPFRRLQVGYEKAPLGLGAQVALGQELTVGPLHRHHAHLQMGGEGPLGGELLPGGEGPRLDVPPDLAVELFIKRGTQARVQHRRNHLVPSSSLLTLLCDDKTTGPVRHSTPPGQGRAKHRP